MYSKSINKYQQEKNNIFMSYVKGCTETKRL